MSSPDELLLSSLGRFYQEPGRLGIVLGVLEPLDSSAMSLRSLDWLVTNYAKKHNIMYEANGRLFNMYCAYKEQLKSFSKKFFDPFRRGERISYTAPDGSTFDTTVGQLNFFRWAIRNGVVEYCASHLADIEADMMESTRSRKVCESAKRHELSQAKSKQCLKVPGRVTVRFE